MPAVELRCRAAALLGVIGVVAVVLTLGPAGASGAFLDTGSQGKRQPAGSSGGSGGLSKPGRPTIVATTDTTVTISWKRSNGRTLTGYHVYRDDVQVASTPDTRFTHTGLSCGTSYRLGVEAYDQLGKRSARVEIVAATAACADTAPPTSPGAVTQVAFTASSITLSWSGSNDNFGVIGYELLVDGIFVGTTAATLYSVSALRCATMYTIGIRALDAAGNRSPAATVLMTTAACPDTTAPSVPASLDVTRVNETSISVSWSPSSDDVGLEGYGVYRDGEAVGSTGSTSYIVAGLECGSSYLVAVDAYDAAGNRSGRSTLTAATSPCAPPPNEPGGDTAPPSAPLDLTVTGATAQSISLAWGASTDNTAVAGYGLYRDGARVGAVSLPTATLSELACGRSYELGVDAYDSAGNRSGRSAVIASTAPCPDTSPPSTPGGLTQTGVSETTVALGWAASTDNVGVAGYGVYLGGIRIEAVASLGYTFASLRCGTTYVVGVDAYDAAGSRSEQTTLAVTTRSCADTQPPTVPQNQTVSGATQTSFLMTWSASTDGVGVAGYTMYLDGARVTTTTATSYTYSGLDCGRTFTVGLEAFDAAGNVSARAQAPAATAACADTSPPSAPANFRSSGSTETTAGVTWSAAVDNVGVTGYMLYLDGIPAGTTTRTDHTFGGLACGTTHAAAVAARDAAGNVSPSATMSVSTSACPPEPPPAGGELYVDQSSRGGSCSDSRSAAIATSPSTPWCTLNRAVAAAPAGATVLVRAGTYPGLAIASNHARSSTVRFKAQSGERVVIDGLEVVNSSYLRFEGFEFSDNVDIRDGAHHVEFVGNHLPGRRVWLYRTSDNLVADNYIHDIRSTNSGGTIGIRLMHDVRVIVRGNRIENLVEDPIQVTKVTDVLIENNVLRNAHPDNGQHTDTIHVLGADRLTIRGNYAYDIQHGLMFTDFQARDVTIENNVIAHITAGAGMKGDGTYGMPNLRIQNNTWWDTRYGVDLRMGHPNGIVRNNIFDTVSSLDDQPVAEYNIIAKPVSGKSYGSHAILKTPVFTDGTSFELAAMTAGIDAGTSNGTPSADRHGRARRDDASTANTGSGDLTYVDIGAHERQSG